MTTIRLSEAAKTDASPAPVASRLREWAPLAVLMIGTFMIVLDLLISWCAAR